MKLLLRFYILSLLLIFTSFGIAQNLPQEHRAAVEKFVQFVGDNNWAQLAEMVHYPLNRPYPVPDIESEVEFIVRRTEVFDDSLIALITNSISDSTSNWTASKDNGFTMNGQLTLDSLGALTTINYETLATKTLKAQLIEEDRASLPVAMQEYERPILQMQTEKFRIRIDETKGPSYRLIVWILGQRNPNIPAVSEIPYGVLATYESRGVQTYTFQSDFGTFVCFISKSKDDGTLPADLLLYRNNELVRAYPAITFEN